MSETATPLPSLKARLTEIGLLASTFGALFLIVNFFHFRTLPVSVILYACMWDMLLALAIIIGVYCGFWRTRSQILLTEFILTLLGSSLLILLYAVMGPTVIDRSLSIYIVEKIDHRGGEVAEAAMPKIILTEFMQEYHVSDVRMTEQVTSRTVKIEDGCIRLTPRGKRLASFTRFYRNTFLPKFRRVGNEITDILTDPYADTPVLVPFGCPTTVLAAEAQP